MWLWSFVENKLISDPSRTKDMRRYLNIIKLIQYIFLMWTVYSVERMSIIYALATITGLLLFIVFLLVNKEL